VIPLLVLVTHKLTRRRARFSSVRRPTGVFGKWEDGSIEQTVGFVPRWRVRCPLCERRVRLTLTAAGYRCPRCEVRLRRIGPARVVAVLGTAT
jgi:hypothetical protein